MQPRKFNHRFTRRKKGHDYKKPCIYHLIIHKLDSAPSFGNLKGNPGIQPGEKGCAYIGHSPLGKIINRNIWNLKFTIPGSEVYQYITMPDHIHILLHVKMQLPKHLSHYIGDFKREIKRQWVEKLSEDQPDAPVEELFAENYTDKPIYSRRNLHDIYRYIRENPHRLAIRKMFPEFFQRIRNLEYQGEKYQLYGNIMLMRNPFKADVHVHHDSTPAEIEELRDNRLQLAADGGVIVSPFIHAEEKKIYRELIETGSKIIKIEYQAFGERYKPSEREFNLCSEGRMLIIAPEVSMGRNISKAICNKMNDLAKDIADGKFHLP